MTKTASPSADFGQTGPHPPGLSTDRGRDLSKDRRRAFLVSKRRLAGAWGFAAVVLLVLSWGWAQREDNGLTAESGLGYAFGITGSVLMLLLLAYPLRKRLRGMRNIGKIANWFRLHMLLGIVGPIFILFHANFNLGSVNSTVALAAMLIVATSGIAGRYFYSRIHMGLYGQRALLEDLLDEADASKRALLRGENIPADLKKELQALQEVALQPCRTLFQSGSLLLTLNLKARLVRPRLTRHLRKANMRDAEGELALFLATLRKVAGLAFYERLFALWHVLHVPLFLLLVMAATAHIFAVHLY